MSRAVISAFVAVAVHLAGADVHATGSNATGDGTTSSADEGSGEVAVGAGQPGSGWGGGVGPVCSWAVVTVGEVATLGEPELGDGVVVSGDPSAPLKRVVNGKEQTGFWRTCPGGTQFRWIDTDTSPTDLLPGLRDSMSKSLPVPSPDLSPVVAGVVNLGMWLAVEPVEPVVLSAEAGLAWIRLRAVHTSTRFEFGNGDAVTCVGVGTPIVELDTVEEGPCGYTYRRPSPPGEPFRLTVSMMWALSFESSDGAGSLPVLTRSTTVEYPVREIQTIGVQG